MSGTTLRDALTEAFAAQEAQEEPTQTEAVSPEPVETAEPVKADRPRDEAGRFAPKAEKPPEATTEPVEAKPAEQTMVEQVQERKAPTSWKKEYWDAYQKLDPKLADYITQREAQFASGVSTYKQEAERAREMFEAIAPFQQDLQQYNIKPSDWIRRLGGAHQTLVRGSPEQKLQVFRQLAQDYGVTLDAVQSGQPDQVMTYLSPLQEQVRQLQGQLMGWQQQQQQREQQAIQSEIEQFSAQHEHFESVKETMAGLLQAGLAQDLSSAYEKALRMNDELWQADQQRQAQEAEKQRREAEAARVASARAKAVSVKSATPTGAMVGSGKKDLRSILSEAVEQHLGGARV